MQPFELVLSKLHPHCRRPRIFIGRDATHEQCKLWLESTVCKARSLLDSALARCKRNCDIRLRRANSIIKTEDFAFRRANLKSSSDQCHNLSPVATGPLPRHASTCPHPFHRA